MEQDELCQGTELKSQAIILFMMLFAMESSLPSL